MIPAENEAAASLNGATLALLAVFALHVASLDIASRPERIEAYALLLALLVVWFASLAARADPTLGRASPASAWIRAWLVAFRRKVECGSPTRAVAALAWTAWAGLLLNLIGMEWAMGRGACTVRLIAGLRCRSVLNFTMAASLAIGIASFATIVAIRLVAARQVPAAPASGPSS